jgi:Ca2+:H+ antiporter
MKRKYLSRKDYLLIGVSILALITAGVMPYSHASGVISFFASGISLALMASLIGRSVEAIGEKLSASLTGIIQSSLGNLPELFVIAFALKAGLTTVVIATIVGSIVANILLVLGLAFLLGGRKHGVQKFSARAGRSMSLLLMLAVFAISIPTLTSILKTPAAGHERSLSVAISVILLTLFILGLIHSLKGSGEVSFTRDEAAERAVEEIESEGGESWPIGIALTVLGISSIAAAFVSDWFVSALTPAMNSLHISQVFAGLVIVAIAGNAVENVVGVQLAYRNKMDYALQVIIQSPLQIALFITPLSVLASPLLGVPGFTLVFSPLMLVALLFSTLIVLFVLFDGESNWLEGSVMIALYGMLATGFWWG